MKRLITILLTTAALIAASFSANAGTFKKSYDFKGFNNVDVSSFFDVTIEKSNNYSTEVYVSDEYKDYLDIKVKGNTLYIGFRNLPTKLQVKSVTGRIANATITLPELAGLNLSGAAKAHCIGAFDLGRGVFNLQASGASSFDGLNVVGSTAKAYLSGSAKGEMKGDFVDMDITASGAARGEMKIGADKLTIKSSGAAVIEMEGEYDELDFGASGSANITIEGAANTAKYGASGAASIDAAKLMVADAKVDISGAAVCKVDASESLKVTASGAAKCMYKDNKKLKVKEEGVSRGATVRSF